MVVRGASGNAKERGQFVLLGTFLCILILRNLLIEI